MRKPAFCICESKDADQLRGNREADQRLYFHYTDSVRSTHKSHFYAIKTRRITSGSYLLSNIDKGPVVRNYLRMSLVMSLVNNSLKT